MPASRKKSTVKNKCRPRVSQLKTPCCPHLPYNHFSWKYECATFRSFATGALVAPPCAPDAPSSQQKSYSSRSRLAKSNGRFAPLSLKQDCFFRVPSSKITIYFTSPPLADNVLTFHLKTLSSKTPLRQLSKVCDCFADAWVWKSSLRSASTDFQKIDV